MRLSHVDYAINSRSMRYMYALLLQICCLRREKNVPRSDCDGSMLYAWVLVRWRNHHGNQAQLRLATSVEKKNLSVTVLVLDIDIIDIDIMDIYDIIDIDIDIDIVDIGIIDIDIDIIDIDIIDIDIIDIDIIDIDIDN